MNSVSPGIMLIDKPAGITSFDVIRSLRTELGVRKMGHAGTLDPRATGLMIVAVGETTKELSHYLGLPKTYEAGIVLGIRTDTGDLDGTVVEERPVPPLSAEAVASALASLVGELALAVPSYSAVKRAGKPLYAYARAGVPVDAPVKTMRVRAAALVSFSLPTVMARFDVGSGTYIRSLAEELGRRLGTVASLGSLRRTSIGPYLVRDARPLAGM